MVPRARNLADEIRVESHNQKTRWEMPRSSMKDESCPSWIKRVKKRGACAQRTDVEADVETVWSRHSDKKKKKDAAWCGEQQVVESPPHSA